MNDAPDGLVASLVPASVAVVEGPIDATSDEAFPEEMALVGNAVAARRLEFVCGRLFARRACLALGVSSGPLLADANRAPLWPEGLVGSLTHTRDYCAAAVARASDICAIGIDVEKISRLNPGLVRVIATPNEIETMLGGLSEEGLQRRLALLFSAKESLYKCVYALTGLRLTFHDVAVEPTHSSQFRARQLVAKEPVGPFFDGFYRMDGDHVATCIVVPAA